MPPFSEEWTAISREGELIAQQLGIGATALGRANYAEVGYYYQAFFALTIALERLAKLALAFDHARNHQGQFPDSNRYKSFGHDLLKLRRRVELTATAHSVQDPHRTDANRNAEIETESLEVLTGFAKGINRYYNLEMLSSGSGEMEEPIAAWHQRVTRFVLEEHLSDRSLVRMDSKARLNADLLSGSTIVRFTGEENDHINDVYEMTFRSLTSEFARRWERMYVLRTARLWIRTMLGAAGAASRVGVAVPDLKEFFSLYLQPDSFLRDRKSWDRRH
jgi:hypothetical protein